MSRNNDTTTTTTVSDDDTTTTTTEADSDTTTTTTEATADETAKNPGKDELLDSAATASPHAERNAEVDGKTHVLGENEQTAEELQDQARHEALANSKGEQDLRA